MIDLHTHSLFSDGVLLPSELVYRAKVKGYTAIALTDHGDFSTFDFVIPRISRVARILSEHYELTVLPGIEITYVPPALIARAVRECRKLGAKIVVIHGETPAETVPPGTNRAAVLSGADVLAHPGPIAKEDVLSAAAKNVALEITTRNGHSAGNRHVASFALKYGAPLVLDTDTHCPENLMDRRKIAAALKMSGLKASYFSTMQENAAAIVRRATSI